MSRDEHTLTRIPGIGKKTAGRIVVELRDKIRLSDEIAVQLREPDTLIGEGIEALMALGYTEARSGLNGCVRPKPRRTRPEHCSGRL